VVVLGDPQLTSTSAAIVKLKSTVARPRIPSPPESHPAPRLILDRYEKSVMPDKVPALHHTRKMAAQRSWGKCWSLEARPRLSRRAAID